MGRKKRKNGQDLGHEEITLPNIPIVQNGEDNSLPASTQDALTQYLAEINKYPLLTKEEEEQLTRTYYETRDPAIASRIVTSNLRLVVKIALDFQNSGCRTSSISSKKATSGSCRQ